MTMNQFVQRNDERRMMTGVNVKIKLVMMSPAPSARAIGSCKRCWPWLLLSLLAGLLYLASFSAYSVYRPHIWRDWTPEDSEVEQRLAAQSSIASFVVDTPGCRIPALDAWDPIVRPLVSRERPIHCGRPPLVTSDDSHLYIKTEHLSLYNTSSPISCCYKQFWRPEGDPDHYSHGVDDAIRMSNVCVPFTHGSRVGGVEFVKVECREGAGGRLVYRDFHAFAPLKASVERRCWNASGPPWPSPERPSVLVVGVDAVSRLNFHRQMNGTAAELSRLGAVEMLGYNKVGDNTFPNLVPVLAGLTESELRNSCWPTDRSAFDDCPFIWKDFRDAGYRTAFGQDAPWMGIFSYLKVGFVRQPTDYYARPYMKLSEDELGHRKQMNAKLCVGARMTAEVLLEYAGRVARALRRRRFFALFWGASLSHDFLNYPSAGDHLYVRLLRDLEATGALNHTVVVLMSDHGIRWGPIRETYQGRLEERLPLLSLLLPAGFRERFPAAAGNLRRNARRLSTPFDLHETLRDLLHAPRALSPEQLRARAQQAAAGPPRGLSLFTALPASRTCRSAGVAPHWCTCQESQQLSAESDDARRAAAFVVSELNVLLFSHRECAKLALVQIRDARLLVARKSQLAGGSGEQTASVDVLVTLRTQPGDAVFEATVRRRLPEGKLSLAGPISRINQYGKQSACMTNYRLRLYCFCLTA